MLLYSEIGFWKDVVDKNMPDTRFLIQSERVYLRGIDPQLRAAVFYN